MLIAAIEAYDFQKIHEIKYAPEADRVVVLIAGDNANGKTSLARAFRAVMGGRKAIPENPVRHGADSAAVVVKFDTGITATLSIETDGTSSLEVRDDLGRVKAPQALLDKLIGECFLDPLTFLSLPPKAQREHLLRLIDKDGKIAKLDVRRERLFDRRREVNRDREKLAAQIAGIPKLETGSEIDVAALSTEANKINHVVAAQRELDRALDARAHTETACLINVQNCEALIADLEAKLVSTRSTLVDLTGRRTMASQARIEAEDRSNAHVVEARNAIARGDEISTEIKRAAEQNRAVAAARASNTQREKMEAQDGVILAEWTKLDAEISDIDAQKKATLLAAKLPVDGIGVTADAVTFGPAPLEHASSAEQLRIALAIAIAAQPELRDVWIRDGSLLDDSHLASMVEHARAAGVRLWVERVGTRDPGALVISEGRVVSEPPKTGQLSLV